eukprot:4529824-Amphidinium_carterae.1
MRAGDSPARGWVAHPNWTTRPKRLAARHAEQGRTPKGMERSDCCNQAGDSPRHTGPQARAEGGGETGRLARRSLSVTWPGRQHAVPNRAARPKEEERQGDSPAMRQHAALNRAARPDEGQG